MLKIEKTEVVGWEAAVRGMRNPMNSWDQSDSHYESEALECHDLSGDPTKVYLVDKYVLGSNDLDLMTRLRNAGTDHRKFMRMIIVYMDITAPLYWWKEFDTYIFAMENVVCVRDRTHKAIHYGDASLLVDLPPERKPNDTCPWKKSQ